MHARELRPLRKLRQWWKNRQEGKDALRAQTFSNIHMHMCGGKQSLQMSTDRAGDGPATGIGWLHRATAILSRHQLIIRQAFPVFAHLSPAALRLF